MTKNYCLLSPPFLRCNQKYKNYFSNRVSKDTQNKYKMLPRKLHLEQINRFHDAYLSLNEQIENETDKEKKYELLKKNVELIRFWMEIDDFIEFKVEQKLDDLSL